MAMGSTTTWSGLKGGTQEPPAASPIAITGSSSKSIPRSSAAEAHRINKASLQPFHLDDQTATNSHHEQITRHYSRNQCPGLNLPLGGTGRPQFTSCPVPVHVGIDDRF